MYCDCVHKSWVWLQLKDRICSLESHLPSSKDLDVNILTKGKINCILKSNNFVEGSFFYIISCPVLFLLSPSISHREIMLLPFLTLFSVSFSIHILSPKFINIYPHGTHSNTRVHILYLNLFTLIFNC